MDANQMLESGTFKKLHSNKGFAIDFANIIDGADIGVVQSGGGLRFTLEPRQGLPVLGHIIRKKLHGNKAMEPSVLSFVDHAHSTTADFFEDMVVRDGLADHRKKVPQS